MWLFILLFIRVLFRTVYKQSSPKLHWFVNRVVQNTFKHHSTIPQRNVPTSFSSCSKVDRTLFKRRLEPFGSHANVIQQLFKSHPTVAQASFKTYKLFASLPTVIRLYTCFKSRSTLPNNHSTVSHKSLKYYSTVVQTSFEACSSVAKVLRSRSVNVVHRSSKSRPTVTRKLFKRHHNVGWVGTQHVRSVGLVGGWAMLDP